MALARPVTSRRPQLIRLVKALLASLCVVGIGWAFTLHRDTPEQVINRGEVESVSPSANATNVPAQSSVSVDLQYGFKAVLFIDGKRIPEDQVDVVEAQAVYTFTPASGKEFSRLAGGQHDALVKYWDPTTGSEENSHTYFWRFYVN